MALQVFSDFLNTVGSVSSQIGSAVNTINRTVNTFQNFGSDPVGFITSNRLQGLPIGAETQSYQFSSASWGLSSESLGNDWRVRIHLPTGAANFNSSSILSPLRETGNSMVFPTTPVVNIIHSANYNALQPVHTNYPFQIYQNSQVEDITITCDFPVENEKDGAYWIAAVHFLRSATKMYYGESSNKGAPPPLVHLSGYGDFVFNRVPCVVKLFTVDLQKDIDYIQVPIGGGVDLGPGFERQNVAGGYTYVPTLSFISVTLAPTFSRDQSRQFSLDTFINGGYIGNNKGYI
jgi:hypothetical protein